MKSRNIYRAAAASLAAFAIAGTAGATTINIDGEISSERVTTGFNFLRGLLSGSVFTQIGDSWEFTGTTSGSTFHLSSADLSEGTQQSASGAPTYRPVISTYPGGSYNSPAPSVPEPSAALLMALGLTLTSARMRSQRSR